MVIARRRQVLLSKLYSLLAAKAVQQYDIHGTQPTTK